MQKPSLFQVYNASAGSGKTFILVKEYLKFVLISKDIFHFQKIVAITFTNKAASEMKERVLQNLKDFSEGKQNEILKIILNETAIDQSTIKERSKKILEAILQNYSVFSITTIDSFTHKIIKSFAYDLGLSLNFEVEIDATSLLNEAVEVLISKIGIKKDITTLLIKFSLDKVNEDTSWDISRELNEISKVLLNENDTNHFKKLANKKLIDFIYLKTRLIKQQKKIKTELKKIGDKGLEIIEIKEVSHKDFYRSMLPNYFIALSKNIQNAKFFDQNTLRERIEKNHFYAKSKSYDVKTAIDDILPKLLKLYYQSEQLYKEFSLYKLTLKNIVPLAVLNHINIELSTIKQENNIRLNAEFNQLIADTIKDQPTPFIYERIGQKFMHYFIDEMQDTSVLQWQNLIPLISNVLSQENSNLLLVGDGKQSIYRWRGGKAEQFIELGLKQEDVSKPFYIPKKINTLEVNYRSYSEIVNFNNQFFRHISKFIQNEKYKNLFIKGNNQLENDKKGGFVSLSFLEKQENKDDEKNKYPKKVLEIIRNLEGQFLLSDICVLVRKKNDGIAIANYLSEHKIDIVSSETLLLKNSSKVNFIINLLQIIQHPNNQEICFEILYFLYDYLQLKTDRTLFINKLINISNIAIFKELEYYGIFFNLTSFYSMPFYEKIEQIIRSFKLVQSSDAYIQFFLDVVLEQQKKGMDSQEFLDFWECKKESLSIVACENGNAVQIMTIHKSKGLEFPVVIFPCDLDIYNQLNPTVWLNELPTDIFENFKELLIPFGKELKYISDKTSRIYIQRQQELELDNFNLLYVALTRAVEQLYIVTEKKISTKGEEKTNFYSGIFINYLKEKHLWDNQNLEYCFGNFKRKSPQKKEKISVEFQEYFISTSWQEHNIYLLANSSTLWDTEQKNAISYGNLIHEIMAKVITKNDVYKIVNQYTNQGIISAEKALSIKKNILEIVNHPKVSYFYSDKVTVFNERDIVTLDNQVIIPDRLVFNQKNEAIIIDYKTGKALKTHHQQILKYEQVLQSLNFNVIKKFLIYIDTKILVEEV